MFGFSKQRRLGVNERRTVESRRSTRNERMAGASHLVVRKGLKPALFSLLLVGICFAGVWGWKKMNVTHMLVLRHIQVEGNHVLSSETILAAARVELGTPMTDLRLDSIKSSLERLDLVHQASVRRKFPTTLKISLVEAQALFLVSSPKGWKVYSDKGTRIPLGQDLGLQLPVVVATSKLQIESAVHLLCNLRNMDPELYAEASQVAPNAEGTWTEVFFRNVEHKVLFGLTDDGLAFHRYRLLVQSLSKDLQNSVVIDMRFPGIAVAKPGLTEKQDG